MAALCCWETARTRAHRASVAERTALCPTAALRRELFQDVAQALESGIFLACCLANGQPLPVGLGLGCVRDWR